MTATSLLRPGALEGRAVVAGGVYTARCVRATAIVPGPRTVDDDLAALAAVLASAGGEYFSGCRFGAR